MPEMIEKMAVVLICRYSEVLLLASTLWRTHVTHLSMQILSVPVGHYRPVMINASGEVAEFGTNVEMVAHSGPSIRALRHRNPYSRVIGATMLLNV